MSKLTHHSIQALFPVFLNLAHPGDLKDRLRSASDQIMQELSADWACFVLMDISVSTISEFILCGGDTAGVKAPSIERVHQAAGGFPDLSQAPEGYLKSSLLFDQLFNSGETKDGLRFSGLVIPLVSQDQIIGLLTVARHLQRSPFNNEQWQLLATIANQASLAISLERLTALERKQREQAATLREVARILTSSLDHQEVLEVILDQLARVIEYDSASIMLAFAKQLTLVAHRKFHIPEQLDIPHKITDYPHIQEVLEKRIPVIITDTQKDHRWRQLPKDNYIRGWLGVPLIGKNGVIGLLNLDKEQPNFYSDEDAALAVAFANQATIAIENAQLYTSTQHRVDQLDALQATIADISAELELPRLLEAILKRAVTLLNTTGGDLGLYDEKTNDICIVASYNMGKDYRGTRMAIGEGAMGLSCGNRQPVNVADYRTWGNASSQYKLGRWHAVLAVPFMFGNRIVGAIGIVDRHPTRKFSEADQHLLGLFAQHAAIAVENARLYQSAREAADRRTILHQVSQQIVSASLDLEEIYAAIHSAAAQLMPAEAFIITQYDVTRQIIQDAYLVDRNGRSASLIFPAEQGLSGKVITLGKTIYIEDLLQDADKDLYIHFGGTEQVRSVLAVPMRLRGKVIGMISTQSYSPGAYKPEDHYLLEMLASYAAIAIDNAHLFAHIQQLAVTDPLTDVSNRRHLFDLGRQEFLRANRFGHALSVVMMDIDHFKLVNDRFGHAAGDDVLLQLAKLIRSEVREVDIVGRYGGEEFTIILPETHLALAQEVAERIQGRIRKTFHADIDSVPQITVSMGVAVMDADTSDFSALVNKADMALYAAKEKGRNRVETIPPG